MPLGWYLAQGLMPLGESSSDNEEGPCELPDGRIVCGPHGLVLCGRCCTDYSLLNNDLDDGDNEEDEKFKEVKEVEESLPPRSRTFGPAKVRGTGKVFPSKFAPLNSNTTPLEAFRNRSRFMNIFRRTHTEDNTKVLFLTDGACLNNGQADPKAGWAFFQGENINREPLVISGRLENRGPWGDQANQTSNRAELRAVLAALRFRFWPGEGFKTVVIATDSSYVVDGATQWVKGWVSNGWRTSGGADVKNKDLWEMLLGECERAHDNGLAIQFWKVPREWNTLADEGAKKAAAENDAHDDWSEVMGLAI